MNSWPRVVVSLTVASLISPLAAAQSTRSVSEKLVFPTGSIQDDNFGQQIAVEGTRAVIGSDEESYVYDQIGGDWQRVATIRSAADHSIDLSSGTVLIDNEIWTEPSAGNWTLQAVLRCDAQDDQSGRLDGDMAVLLCGENAIQTFRRSGETWTELEAIPIPTSSSPWHHVTVEVSEPLVFVGNPGNDALGIHWSGSVDLFDFAPDGSWSFDQELTASNAGDSYNFGSRLHIDAQRLAVWARNPPDEGGVYVLENTGGSWSQDPRIHRLAKSVWEPRLGGDRLILIESSAEPKNCGEISNCRLIAYTRQGDGTWLESAAASTGSSDVWDLAINGDSAFVGLRGQEDVSAGMAQVFDPDTIQLLQTIEPDPATSPTFHDIRDLAAAGARLVVRAQGTEDFGYRVFRSDQSGWTQEVEIDEPFTIDKTVDLSIWGPRISRSIYFRDPGSDVVIRKLYSGTWYREPIQTAKETPFHSLFAESVVFSGDQFEFQPPVDLLDTGAQSYDGSGWTDNIELSALGYARLSLQGPELSLINTYIPTGSASLARLERHRLRGDTGWTQLSSSSLVLPFQLNPNGDTESRSWAMSIDSSGERLVAGFWNADTPWQDSGAAVVFRADPGGWVLEADLTPSTVDTEDYFGTSVALIGDTALVGAPGSDLISPNAGAVYVFKRSGTDWTLSEILVAADAKPGDAFGNSLVAWGSRIAIAAPGADGIGADTGAIYILDDPALFPTQIETWLGGAGDEIFYDVLGKTDGSVVAGGIGSWGLGGSEGFIGTYDHYGLQTAGVRFGGGSNDRFEGLAEATDGSFFAAGSQESWGNGGSEAWLVKTGADLSKQWQRSIGGPADEGYAAVAVTTTGGAVAVGWAESWGPGMRSAMVHRFDSSGAKLWGSTRGGGSNDELRDVIVSSHGAIVTVGRQSSWGPAGSNGWLMVFNSLGDRVESKSWGSDFDDGLEAITELEGGGFVAVGWRGTADGSTQGWYLRLDANFNLIATATHGAENNDERFDDVFEVAGQAVYAVGSRDSIGVSNGWFAVLSLRNGSLLVERTTGGASADTFEAIARSGFDGLLVAGSQTSWSTGGQDAWIKAVDWDGSW